MSQQRTDAPEGNQKPTDRALAQVQGFSDLFKKRKTSLEKIARGEVDLDRFLVLFLNEMNRIPGLMECTYQSLLKACTLSISLKLYVGDGFGSAWVIPFKNPSGPSIATFIPGYKGIIDLVKRPGNIVKVEARLVFANDDIVVKYGLAPDIIHSPVLDSTKRGAKVGAYAVFFAKDGWNQFAYMDKAEIEKRKTASKSSGKPESPWNKWEDEMWLKTAVKGGSRLLTLSDELKRALRVDDRAEVENANNVLDADFIDLTDQGLLDDIGAKEDIAADLSSAATASGAEKVEGAIDKAKPGAKKDAVAAEVAKQLQMIVSDFGLDSAASETFLALTPPVLQVRVDIQSLVDKDIDTNEALHKTKATTWAEFLKEQTGGLGL